MELFTPFLYNTMYIYIYISGYYAAFQIYAPNLKFLNFHTPKSLNDIIILDKLGIFLNFYAPRHFAASI